MWAWSQISNLSSVTNSLGNFDKLNLNSLSLGLIVCKMGILVSHREAVKVERDVKWVLSSAEVLSFCPMLLPLPSGSSTQLGRSAAIVKGLVDFNFNYR